MFEFKINFSKLILWKVSKRLKTNTKSNILHVNFVWKTVLLLADLLFPVSGSALQSRRIHITFLFIFLLLPFLLVRAHPPFFLRFSVLLLWIILLGLSNLKWVYSICVFLKQQKVALLLRCAWSSVMEILIHNMRIRIQLVYVLRLWHKK